MLGRINPAIVCVALTGYGRRGPTARLPGYDALIQAESGWASLTGAPGDAPTKSGLSLADYIAGLTAVLGLTVALFDARRTGIGRDVDTNLYDSALAMLSYPATWFLSSGFVTERKAMSGAPERRPLPVLRRPPTATSPSPRPRRSSSATLVERMDLPELVDDERFRDFEGRGRHRDALLAILSARFAERTTETWLAALRGHIPIAPVRSLEEALDTEELTERGMLAAYPHPTLGEVRSVGLPLALGGFEPVYRPGPALGADGDDGPGRGRLQRDGDRRAACGRRVRAG